MAAYIATDAGYAGARDLVAAVGLITVDADGTIKVSKFCEMPDCTFFPCPFLLLSFGETESIAVLPPFIRPHLINTGGEDQQLAYAHVKEKESDNC